MSLHMALVGNPTTGLTTLFNQLTGGIQHLNHFRTPGLTAKEGSVRKHKDVSAIELPGVYSLSSYTVNDLAVRSVLIDETPDVIINVVDATSIERSLYLTLQLMELDMPMVLALNMMDEMRKNENRVDVAKLQEILTIPIVPISAAKGEGIHDLIHCAIETAKEGKRPEKIDFCSGYVHTAIHSIVHLIQEEASAASIPLRFAATKIVEGDELIAGQLKLQTPELDIIQHIIDDMEGHLGTDREAAMADMRYEFIEKLCSATIVKKDEHTKGYLRSVKIDRVLTNKYAAIPIFLGIMFLIFYLTFSLAGAFLSDQLSLLVDAGIGQLDKGLSAVDASPALHSLIIDGVCAGVGSVLSFLPIIAVLFFFLSILEDSGYMPRVAFVMDKLLRKLGLSGRSIVPLLIGFGCSVPAIMATRTLPSKRDRYMTIALTPFMSCSAKLPLYAMMTAAFFAEQRALVMIALYVTGIVVAILCALLMKSTIFRGAPVPFVMVLPSYRMPSALGVWLRMWENIKGFIKKAFTVIFIATIVIWLLQSFDFGLNMVDSQEDSILAAMGRAAAPIFAPLGFGNWQAATALITGLSAKEAVVSTLAVLVGASDSAALSALLESLFTPLSAYAFLVFCLLYMPCVATLASVRREMNGMRYALLVVFFQTMVAWFVAFVVYNVGSLFL